MQIETMNEKMIQMKMKVDEHEYKINNISRNQEAVRNNMTMGNVGNLGYGMNRDFDQSSQILNVVELETEVKLLRG